MSESYVQALSFIVEGQPTDTFRVFGMTGREAISELFRFEIDAVSDDFDVLPDSLVGKGATLTITRLQQTRRIYGMIDRLELTGMTPQGQYAYRLVLVPRLQRLALTRQNQIHGTTTPVTVRDVLNDELTASGLKGAPAAAVSGRLGLDDFELRLTHPYPQRDYVVQYDESDFAFISRLCEHYGIFYFFTHDQGRDVAVFGDARVAFPSIGGPTGIAYRTASGLTNATDAAVFRFVGQTALLPAQVCLRDYNYRLPTVSLEVNETVDANGHGVVVDYGSHFRTPAEGRELARVRAQELSCRKRVFSGAGDSVQMTAGAVFELTDHFCDEFNDGYLVTWVEHEATQALPGIAEFTGAEHQTSYRNRFECLPQSVEFRPVRTTPKPHMAGLSNAVVDAEGSGQRAELDGSGRYKIRQQFDQRGEAAGQASRYMRKAEPYGGANTGMHFPLLKGTEVVIACVNGDPDRPIIVGAMQNEQHPSITNSRNSTRNRLRTTSGTLFEIDDGPAAGDEGGGGSAGSGASLAPQRALEGIPVAPVRTDIRPEARPLARQRAEAEIQTGSSSTTSCSSYARLQVTAGTDAYWRIGSEPTSDTTEDALTPGMSDMTGGSSAGGGGLFEYAAGDRTSLVTGSSYRQVNTNDLDYVAKARRMSAATHNAVSTGHYGVIAQGLSLEASSGTLTDNSSPATTATAGKIVITAASDLSMTVGGDAVQTVTGSSTSSTSGNAITHISGTKVSQTWGSTASFMMGSSVSMTLGSALGVVLGVKTDIFGFMKIDLGVGILDFKFRAGPVIDFAMSAKISAVGAADIKAKTVEIGETIGAAIESASIKMANKALNLYYGDLGAGVVAWEAVVGGEARV